MKMIFLGFLYFLLANVAACHSDKWGDFQGEVDGLSDEQAFSEFRKLSTQDKVDFFVWQIEHSRPPASRFELILKESGRETAPLLINRATTTNNYFTSIAIFRYLATLPVADMSYLQKTEVDSAIRNCLTLEGQSAQSMCKQDGNELYKRLISEKEQGHATFPMSNE